VASQMHSSLAKAWSWIERAGLVCLMLLPMPWTMQPRCSRARPKVTSKQGLDSPRKPRRPRLERRMASGLEPTLVVNTSGARGTRPLWRRPKLINLVPSSFTKQPQPAAPFLAFAERH
jgi:hypothetical protein